MSEAETRSFEQLPPATAVSPDAITAVQEPGGPLAKVKISQLLGRLISTNAAKETEAALQADLAFDANKIGLVFADPAPAKNGWYRKVGASGAGNWTQFEKLSAHAAAEVQVLVDMAEDARDAAIASAESLGSLVLAIADMVINVPAERVGVFPLAAADAAGVGDFNANTTAILCRIPRDGPIDSISVDLRWVLGGGACSIDIFSGTIADGAATADLTRVSTHPLPLQASVGQKTFTSADWGGVINGVEGQWVAFTSIGVAGRSVVSAGQRLYWTNTAAGAGMTTIPSTPNLRLNAWVRFTEPDLQMPRSALADKDFLDRAEAFIDAADPLLDVIGNQVTITGQHPVRLGGGQFNGGTTVKIENGIDVADVISAVEIMSLYRGPTQVGGAANPDLGKVTLVLATGPDNAQVPVSFHPLPPASDIGPIRWAGLNIARPAGHHILLTTPTNGLAQMTSPKGGSSFKWTNTFWTGGTLNLDRLANGLELHTKVETVRPGPQLRRRDLHPDVAAQIPDIPPPLEFDAIGIIGQSNNGTGRGVVGTVEVPPGVLKQFYEGVITDKTRDPIGNAQNNSYAPAQALRHWQRCGRGMFAIPSWTGSSALVPAADTSASGNWSDPGAGGLRQTALNRMIAGLAAAAAANIPINRIIVQYLQGEQDALAIDNGTITINQYAAALPGLVDFFCNGLGIPDLPFIIIPIGNLSAGAPSAGVQAVRAAQIAFARSRANVRLGFTGAFNFHRDNMMWDGQHYDARGANAVGFGTGSVTGALG